MKYNKITPAIIEELKNILGDRFVIYEDHDKIEPYSHDQVMEKEYARMPEVVVKPRTAQEIAAILKLANREMIPVTPRGAGSGLSGGAVPLHGGILLSVERMNSILEIDSENLVVVAEPGVVTNDINEKVKELGLFYAGYPMSVESCFIGGNVAENAGGGRAVKYGVTERYIIGIELVTPEGEIITLGGKRLKDVVGYDLIKLMVGSEGTLGIFTKITIRLMPLPREKANLLVLFKNEDDALTIVPEIMAGTRIIPTSLEFMDRLSVHSSCRYLNEHLPYEEAGAMLLIELDGNSKIQIEEEYEAIGDLCMKHGAMEVYVADNATTSERIWKVRRNIGESLMAFSSVKSSEDIVVPIARIAEMLRSVKVIAEKWGVVIPCFGHAGDGNIHTTIVKKPEMSMDSWRETIGKVQHDLYTETVRLGGTISGEHGVGHKKKKFIGMVLEPGAIELMKRVKRAFDPNNILNPGKIFDL